MQLGKRKSQDSEGWATLVFLTALIFLCATGLVVLRIALRGIEALIGARLAFEGAAVLDWLTDAAVLVLLVGAALPAAACAHRLGAYVLATAVAAVQTRLVQVAKQAAAKRRAELQQQAVQQQKSKAQQQLEHQQVRVPCSPAPLAVQTHVCAVVEAQAEASAKARGRCQAAQKAADWQQPDIYCPSVPAVSSSSGRAVSTPAAAFHYRACRVSAGLEQAQQAHSFSLEQRNACRCVCAAARSSAGVSRLAVQVALWTLT